MHPLMLEISPEEQYRILGHAVTVRRDDLAFKEPLPPNAKMAALYEIVKHAYSLGYREAVLFAKKQVGIPYAIGFPVICKEFNMKATITIPATEKSIYEQWQLDAIWRGAEIIKLHPNMITINVNQSKKIADDRKAFFVPFGFEDPISVKVHSEKFSLPDYEIGTLVLSTMTGMILAGVLKQIHDRQYKVKNVYGISSGRSEASVYKSMKKNYPNYDSEVGHLMLLEAFKRNEKPALDKSVIPFSMHPDYEYKAWAWLVRNIDRLEEPIYFINSGR